MSCSLLMSSSETLTILGNMPSTQFGLNSPNLTSSNKIPSVITSVSRSNTPAQFQAVPILHSQAAKPNVQGISIPQHHLPPYSVSVSSRDVASPHRGLPNTSYQLATSKPNVQQLPTTVPSVLPQMPATTVSSTHAAAMAAVAAVVAAQRSGGNADAVSTQRCFCASCVKTNCVSDFYLELRTMSPGIFGGWVGYSLNNQFTG